VERQRQAPFKQPDSSLVSPTGEQAAMGDGPFLPRLQAGAFWPWSGKRDPGVEHVGRHIGATEQHIPEEEAIPASRLCFGGKLRLYARIGVLAGGWNIQAEPHAYFPLLAQGRRLAHQPNAEVITLGFAVADRARR
jgi:hypothetical protein